MSGRNWSLEDLVEFEARLEDSERSGAAEKRRYRELVEEVPKWPRAEAARRRLGLKLWLQVIEEGEEREVGERVVSKVRLTGILLGGMAVLSGIGVMRGLLTDVLVRSYNVWLFLAAAIGVQWLVLILGIVGYGFVRRQSGALSLFQQMGSWLTRRFSGQLGKGVWKNLLEGGAGYRSALSWRLARMTQGVAIMFNVGLLVGFFGCLLFFSVRFYWESTFEGSGWGLVDVMKSIASPWSWSGLGVPPLKEEVAYSVLKNPTLEHRMFYEKDGVEKMWLFLVMSLFCYGLLPRALLWLWCVRKERKSLRTLAFQAPRHRDLWRRLSKVERSLVSSGQGDGVVLLDVGGIDLDPQEIREFLLRELRVNPKACFTAGVLDGDREKEALAAIEEAELGVVLLVEGWALSPRQMEALHRRLRAVGGGDMAVNVLVIGELRNGRPSAPASEDWEQWKTFVDSLQDPATEVVAYGEPEAREGRA